MNLKASDKLRRLSVAHLEEFRMRFMLAELVERASVEYDSTQDCLSIPKMDIPFLVDSYMDSITMATTWNVCTCVWREHPDDLNKPQIQRRKVRMGESETEACPIHTSKGLILGFFQWVFNDSGLTVRHEEVKDADSPE